MADAFDWDSFKDPIANQSVEVGGLPSDFVDPLEPPEEPALLGIPRGLKTGLTKDLPGAAGKAMQFVASEGSEISKVGKSLEEYSQEGLPQEEGFWEKGARTVGAMLPMIVASAVNPVAGVAAGA